MGEIAILGTYAYELSESADIFQPQKLACGRKSTFSMSASKCSMKLGIGLEQM